MGAKEGEGPDDAWIDAVSDEPDALSDDLGWRRRLAKWPDLWRERWGRRANALEEGGMAWVEAERQAWNEVLAAKRAAETTATIPMTRTQARFKETA